MSGSGHQRTYDTLNKTIVNSSDYIQKKRDMTRWKSLSNNAASSLGTINPRKKNGYYYQDNYFATNARQAIPGKHDASSCIIAAKNYDLLQSISRGKYYANPLLDGSEVLSGSGMWNGNILQIKYQTGCDQSGNSCGNYYAPIRLTDLYNSTTPESPYWGSSDASSGYDFIPFPNSDDAQFTGYHNGLIPGFIIDPSNTIFYEKCIGPKFGIPGDPGAPPWLSNGLSEIAFNNTLYYWKGVNAQPLAGYKFPQPISLNYQTTAVTALNRKYLPLIPGNTVASKNPQDILQAWCNGLSAIN